MLIFKLFLPSKLQFPRWGETEFQAGERYKHLIKDLADKYPTQNLLLITHGKHPNSSLFNVMSFYDTQLLFYIYIWKEK